jgi:hypothetical protein
MPTVLLSLVISMLIGALYHLWRGGGGGRLLLFLLASALGFLGGGAAGERLEFFIFMLGSINLGMGTAGSLVFLFGAEWLSRIDLDRGSGV